jgi:dipeptidyl aminopeptidase
MAAAPSIDRHLFSASLPTMPSAETYKQKHMPLTDAKQPGYHEVSFSPRGRYYVLQYKGPEVPWQRVLETSEDKDGERSHLFCIMSDDCRGQRSARGK